jgi:hypothetical protein
MYGYARQEQLTRSIAWIARSPLAVTVNGHPNVYLICRVSPDGSRMAIGLQNAHLDPIVRPVFRLEGSIKIGPQIEILPADGDKTITTEDFIYTRNGDYGYLTMNFTVPAMGFIGIGLMTGRS